MKRKPALGPVVNGERFAPGYTREAARYEQVTRRSPALASIPDGSEVYYEDGLLKSLPGEQPRTYWVVIRWRTPKGKRVDHSNVAEFSGRTWREADNAMSWWIKRARAKPVSWPTSWNGGEV